MKEFLFSVNKVLQKNKKVVLDTIESYLPAIYLNGVGFFIFSQGEMAEWLKAPHSKCGIGATLSGVRIPLSPPKY